MKNSNALLCLVLFPTIISALACVPFPAQAQDRGRYDRDWRAHEWRAHHYWRHPQPGIIYAPPVAYPPPDYYTPAPPVYYPATPQYAAPGINLVVPLRIR